jgi:hypothetical protein
MTVEMWFMGFIVVYGTILGTMGLVSFPHPLLSATIMTASVLVSFWFLLPDHQVDIKSEAKE